jgi:PKD domain/WD40-like Beta Propeller Repeat
MKLFRFIVMLYIVTSNAVLAQEHYIAKKAYFSSDKYDEFSPVITGNRLVFCSNRNDELFVTYINKEKKGLFKIFSVQLNDSIHHSRPVMFSRYLNSSCNDGPIAFDSSGKKAVYSRNIDIDIKKKDFLGSNDNLGLFFTEFADGKWTNISPFKYNDPSYSNTTPFLTPDGKCLYFASDRPGGFGGSDLYRSEYRDSSWTEPVNLGSIINSAGNELSPFINSEGLLFFASDGHPGLGKKDLFMSRETSAGWSIPLHLDPPINSPFDDFSLITDSAFTSGYFSSDRNGSDDIFRFETEIPQLFNCDTLKKNQYCFQFWDDKYPGADSLPVVYEWQFSDGSVIKGLTVEHCFPGAGKYRAKLNIVDNTTSNTFFTRSDMEFEIKDFEQPYIISKDTAVESEQIKFSALKSNLPGFVVKKYIWDFGDGDFMTGSEVVHSFKKEGVYNVKLGLTGKRDDDKIEKTNCIFKPLRIIPDK